MAGRGDVKATINGFFFITFRTRSAMDDAIDGGPWFFQGHPLVLQRWEPGMALNIAIPKCQFGLNCGTFQLNFGLTMD
ncbi:UNVERIFIED_CONTAM: hypothetical protein Slati_0893800 [Sesamum latifolium]|uniref:DUF4283 domain-containing protein n=1 Tax=Sesamum latifolium TaxID=2727402 RepID=A0AAW2XTB7_9LAMI